MPVHGSGRRYRVARAAARPSATLRRRVQPHRDSKEPRIPEFDVPEGLRFTCSECGDCCRGGHVLLSDDERERLAALDWSGIAEDLAGSETTVAMDDGPFRGHHRLAHRADGACVYLGARQQCRIHEHFGAPVKPLPCRAYPFAFRATGDRVAVDVAFSCRAVSEGMGAPVSASPAWESMLLERPLAASRPVALTRSRDVAPELALEIEATLIAFLRDGSLSPMDRVHCCCGFLALGLTGDPATPAAAMLRHAIASGLPARVAREPHVTGMDATQRTVFRQWLFLALNPGLANAGEASAARRRRDVQRWRDQGIAFRDGAGSPVLAGVAIRATFDDVDRVEASLMRTSELTTAFLAAKLIGQRFLVTGPGAAPLIESARLLMLCWPMIAWVSKAFAADRGSARVEDADVRLAIRRVDRTLGQVTLALFPAAQAKAFHWTIHETDLVAAAMRDVMGG